MGAHEFFVVAAGATASEAYRVACRDALAEMGHQDGYNGTVSTTSGFGTFRLPAGVTPRRAYELWTDADYAEQCEACDEPVVWRTDPTPGEKLLGRDLARSIEKWGPCACVPAGDGLWAFFGLAAS